MSEAWPQSSEMGRTTQKQSLRGNVGFESVGVGWVDHATRRPRAAKFSGFLQPVRYQAERRQFAAARREVFVEPPARRNRVWQADFSQFETTSEGTWRLCGVVDYAAKVALACPVTTTGGATDLIAALQAAVDAAEALTGRRLIEDCVDATTGEIVALTVVTDNGPAMKSVALARWFATWPHLAHVRTRHRGPVLVVTAR